VGDRFIQFRLVLKVLVVIQYTNLSYGGRVFPLVMKSLSSLCLYIRVSLELIVDSVREAHVKTVIITSLNTSGELQQSTFTFTS